MFKTKIFYKLQNIWQATKISMQTNSNRLCNPYKWRINLKLFHYNDCLWGPHMINRFVAQHNTRLKRYDSLFWDPETKGIDALTQCNWGEENNYANPLFYMVPKILELLQKEKAIYT